MARSWAGARSGSSGGAPAIASAWLKWITGISAGTSGIAISQQVEGRLRLGLQRSRHPGQRVPKHRQHVAVVADEAELGVE